MILIDFSLIFIDFLYLGRLSGSSWGLLERLLGSSWAPGGSGRFFWFFVNFFAQNTDFSQRNKNGERNRRRVSEVMSTNHCKNHGYATGDLRADTHLSYFGRQDPYRENSVWGITPARDPKQRELEGYWYWHPVDVILHMYTDFMSPPFMSSHLISVLCAGGPK